MHGKQKKEGKKDTKANKQNNGKTRQFFKKN